VISKPYVRAGRGPIVKLWDKCVAPARAILSALAEEEMRIHQQESRRAGPLPPETRVAQETAEFSE
jgi:hypothetical protein